MSGSSKFKHTLLICTSLHHVGPANAEGLAGERYKIPKDQRPILQSICRRASSSHISYSQTPCCSPHSSCPSCSPHLPRLAPSSLLRVPHPSRSTPIDSKTSALTSSSNTQAKFPSRATSFRCESRSNHVILPFVARLTTLYISSAGTVTLPAARSGSSIGGIARISSW